MQNNKVPDSIEKLKWRKHLELAEKCMNQIWRKGSRHFWFVERNAKKKYYGSKMCYFAEKYINNQQQGGNQWSPTFFNMFFHHRHELKIKNLPKGPKILLPEYSSSSILNQNQRTSCKDALLLSKLILFCLLVVQCLKCVKYVINVRIATQFDQIQESRQKSVGVRIYCPILYRVINFLKQIHIYVCDTI